MVRNFESAMKEWGEDDPLVVFAAGVKESEDEGLRQSAEAAISTRMAETQTSAINSQVRLIPMNRVEAFILSDPRVADALREIRSLAGAGHVDCSSAYIIAIDHGPGESLVYLGVGGLHPLHPGSPMLSAVSNGDN